jgi:hypothetical protein
MANSIYDGEFLNNFQSYRNKQRLAGGQIDPRVVGSLAEADLNSRYADQRSRRSQDLQEKSINNQYALGQAGLAQSAANSAQNYDFLRKQLSAQKSSAGISNMGSIANILLQGGALANKAGLWGEQPKPSEQELYYKDLRERNATQGMVMPSLYSPSYAATQGPSADEWSYGGGFDGGYDSYSPPNMDSYASAQGPSDDEWLYNTFIDYFDSF